MTLGSSLQDDGLLSEFKDAKLGKRLGNESSEKDVYELVDHPDLVIGISKVVGDYNVKLNRLKKEIDDLNKLKNEGLPVVEYNGLTTHNGTPAIVMKKYAQGSKDIVANDKTNFSAPIRVGDSQLLNETSIKDLTKILLDLKNKKIQIEDLQFLIDKDGRLVITDPFKIIIPGNSFKQMGQTVYRLIEAAGENTFMNKIFVTKGKTINIDEATAEFTKILKGTAPKNVNVEDVSARTRNILSNLKSKGILRSSDDIVYVY